MDIVEWHIYIYIYIYIYIWGWEKFFATVFLLLNGIKVTLFVRLGKPDTCPDKITFLERYE